MIEYFELAVTGADEKKDVEKMRYTVTIKIPHKAPMLELLPLHMDHIVHSFKCNTGPLAAVSHEIIICLFRECNDLKIGVFTSVGKHAEKIIELNMIDVAIIMSSGIGFESPMARSTPPKNLSFDMDPTLENWYSSDFTNFRNDFWTFNERWQEDVNGVILTLNALARNKPKIVDIGEEAFPKVTMNGNINISQYFMNPDLSDFEIVCHSTTFPVHRIVLSNRSEYFETLFNSKLKECTDGRLTIEDMSSTACNEFLRFIYTGKVENLMDHVTELYVASDKYRVPDLKNLCEQKFYRDLNAENSLEIFDLCSMHGSSIVAKLARKVILKNWSKFAPNAEALKNFTIKYPELVFELLTVASNASES